MILRITFLDRDGKNKFTMLFGNSYKKWHVQMIEFMGRYFCNDGKGWRKDKWIGRILRVEKSNAPWIGWGGLKWCEDKEFQEELNREGVQRNEPDNPNPRLYAEMDFVEMKPSYATRYFSGY